VVKIAIKQLKVSDLDGSEGADFGLVVRDYPGMDQAKILDLTKEQAETLMSKALKNIVACEVRLPDGSSQEVMMTKAEFDKFAGGNAETLLKQASNLRGRRPGFSPTNGH
jgi:hypothetical protein